MTPLTRAGYYRPVMKDWKYNGAFVIQFQPETDLETGRCQGRVEHIVTYKTVRFHSVGELLAFVNKVLKETRSSEEQELTVSGPSEITYLSPPVCIGTWMRERR